MIGPARQVAIVGIGRTAVSRSAGRTPLDLSCEAVQLALDDSGVAANELDGLFSNVGAPLGCDYDRLAEAMGLTVRTVVQTWSHGRFVATAVQAAVQAVALGTCEVAACLGGVAFSQVGMVGGSADTEGERQGGGSHGEVPHIGLTAPGGGAAMAHRRYCDRYGYEPEMVGAVPIALRDHARRNPDAQMRAPMSMETYLDQPHIIEPLRRPDFALLSDGGGCLLVTTLERARDLAAPAVVVAGFQGIRAGRDEFIFAPPGLGVFSQEDRRRTEDQPVYAMAGIGGPQEVDTLAVYDAFSPNVVFALERFGFVGEGGALAWVQDGRIGPGGQLPVNTAGGLLSEAHLCGWGHMIELVRQLRGGLGQRQVPDCSVAQWATPWGDSIVMTKDQ
ncbi:thiolase family protein [Pseudonocardia dioxanivorans]|uniref:thiolase family protein n=1 Tax=Pseudonocardia dioxanivorans TaxID=240495 RepID=UPI000CD0D34C|nr:thiolase family protein [Pseudonocardia dioxanivorans]